MANTQLRGVVNQLRRIVGRRCGSTLTDAQLLEDFVSRRDQASFEVLVWRHGAMVLSLCQRILRDSHEAEDAFQAAFLIFARKAKSIGKRAAVGSWLYKVAYRVALRLRAKAARRDTWEQAADDLPARPTADSLAGRELRPVLDEEIGRLPEKYRVPLVLCYLEGHTNEEAAEQLGCPKGTILSRLARGRERLRSRLTRRGFALSALALATALSESAASAALPAPLVAATVEAATVFAAGQVAAGLVSASVVALSEGVIHAMFLTKLKIATAAMIALVITGAGAGIISQRTLADTERLQVRSPSSVVRSKKETLPATDYGLRTTDIEERSRLEDLMPGFDSANLALAQERRPEARGPGAGASEVHGMVKSVDAAAGKITLTKFVGRGRDEPPVETTYALAKDVEVAVGFAFLRGSYFKEGKVADLAAGIMVHLTLAADKSTVESILAEEPTVRARLKAADAAKGTLTITLAERPREGRVRDAQAPEEKTFTVAKDAEVAIDDGRGGRFSYKEGKLADLADGALVTLRLSIDKQRVQAVLAEGPTHQGTVKQVDAAKKKLTLVVRPGRGDDAGEELSLQVPDDALILVDDGKGRRLSVKPGKLASIPVGAEATVRMTVDQQFVTSLRAQGPTLYGLLKGVDANGSITIAIPKGRGEEPEQKTLKVAPNAVVDIEGTRSKLADLKVGDDGPHVQLRLSLDQTTVQSITAPPAGRR